MEYLELADFLTKHWQLFGIFLILIVAYIIFEIKNVPSEKHISPQQLINMYNKEHAVIIDIRSHDAYNAGHITGSLNIEISELANKLNKLKKLASKPVIIVCAIGKSSDKFANQLKQHGFKKIFQLAGGLQAWQMAGLPLITKAKQE